MTIEFQAWGKTPRLFRDIIVTEKIDGTNSAVIIQEVQPDEDVSYQEVTLVESGGKWYEVGAQSRNRLIFPGKTTDNYGFAAWVQENAEQLLDVLGPGRHFGEWWGKGIARGYGREERSFSLFNVDRYDPGAIEGGWAREVGDHFVEIVPILYRGVFSEEAIHECLRGLEQFGSEASGGFMYPEGICVYHTQSKQVYKYTVDDRHKEAI